MGSIMAIMASIRNLHTKSDLLNVTVHLILKILYRTFTLMLSDFLFRHHGLHTPSPSASDDPFPYSTQRRINKTSTVLIRLFVFRGGCTLILVFGVQRSTLALAASANGNSIKRLVVLPSTLASHVLFVPYICTYYFVSLNLMSIVVMHHTLTLFDLRSIY